MEVQGAGEPVAKDLTQFAGGGGRGGQGLSLSHGGSIWDVKDDRPGEERGGQGFPGRWLSQGEHLTHAIWKEPDRVTDGSGERGADGGRTGAKTGAVLWDEGSAKGGAVPHYYTCWGSLKSKLPWPR